MAKKAKQEDKEVEEYHLFICVNCDKDGDNPMEHKQLMEHLESVHQLKRPIQGTRSLTMHIDGSTWYQSTYELEVGDIHLIEQYRARRSHDDPMRLEGI